MVTVALDLMADKAHPWIDAAAPTHPSLVDSAHITDELLGFTNVPMAVWIDEDGMLVRPAEHASIERSALADQPIPEDIPDRLRTMLGEVKKMPDTAEVYRSAVADWVANGSESEHALSPDQVIARSAERTIEHSTAAASFELGLHLRSLGRADDAVQHWRRAHELFPDNWTYKRQAWTLETTPDGEPSDLIQGPNELYEGNWLDDVVAQGGGGAYYTPAFP